MRSVESFNFGRSEITTLVVTNGGDFVLVGVHDESIIPALSSPPIFLAAVEDLLPQRNSVWLTSP